MAKGTLQSAATSAGNGVAADVSIATGVTVEVSGTFTGLQLAFEGLSDAAWVPVALTNTASGLSSAVAAATGTYRGDVSGYSQFRARIAAIASGAVSTTINSVEPGQPSAEILPLIVSGTYSTAQTSADQNTPHYAGAFIYVHVSNWRAATGIDFNIGGRDSAGNAYMANPGLSFAPGDGTNYAFDFSPGGGGYWGSGINQTALPPTWFVVLTPDAACDFQVEAQMIP